MILTVTLNPCIDRTIHLETLTPGGHHRVSGCTGEVGGKGINVSTVLAHLGVPTVCTGLNYTDGFQAVPAALDSQSIPHRLLDVPGGIRVNLKLTEHSGRMTEINENGTRVDPGTADRMLALLEELLPQAELLVADGSVPPGVRGSIYAEMITLAKAHHVRTVLDAAGELLRNGLEAGPWLVKPNRYELETLLGTSLPDLPSAAAAARKLLRQDGQIVCLSLGSDGALLACTDGTWFCGNLDVPVRGLQGAGDSMVAGLCAAFLKGLSAPDMLRWGVAAAHASLVLPGTGLCRRKDMEVLLPELKVTRID